MPKVKQPIDYVKDLKRRVHNLVEFSDAQEELELALELLRYNHIKGVAVCIVRVFHYEDQGEDGYNPVIDEEEEFDTYKAAVSYASSLVDKYPYVTMLATVSTTVNARLV